MCTASQFCVDILKDLIFLLPQHSLCTFATSLCGFGWPATVMDAFYIVLTDLSFIQILQQNTDTMKVESDIDALSEVDPICMNTDEVYVPAEFSIMKTEVEVSLVSRCFSLL